MQLPKVVNFEPILNVFSTRHEQPLEVLLDGLMRVEECRVRKLASPQVSLSLPEVLVSASEPRPCVGGHLVWTYRLLCHHA